MSAKVTRDRKSNMQREAPPVLLVVVVILLVLGLGAGAFYAYNGGWRTAAQQDEDYKHNLMPLMAARHGNMQPLEAENKLRKEQGRPLLDMSEERKQTTGDPHQRLMDLRQQLEARQGKQTTP